MFDFWGATVTLAHHHFAALVPEQRNSHVLQYRLFAQLKFRLPRFNTYSDIYLLPFLLEICAQIKGKTHKRGKFHLHCVPVGRY